jgi:hypothetical protein
MARDARAEAQRERQYYSREARVRCMVCGRHLLASNKKGWACSKKCREQLQGAVPSTQ